MYIFVAGPPPPHHLPLDVINVCDKYSQSFLILFHHFYEHKPKKKNPGFIFHLLGLVSVRVFLSLYQRTPWEVADKSGHKKIAKLLRGPGSLNVSI